MPFISSLACSPATAPGLVAIALPTSGTARLAAYIGDGATNPFVLPAGTYVVEIADAAGHVKRLDNVGAGRLALPSSVADSPANAARAKDLRSLARFALGADAVRLIILSQVSAGYTKPLFDRSVQYDYALAVTLADQSKLVAAELDSAVAALDRTAYVEPDRLVASVAGAPRPGILSGIKEKLTGFVEALVRPGQNSRDRIKKLGAAIRPAEKQAAFDAVRADLRFGATTWDEFLGKLDQVPWYDMAPLENGLRHNAPSYSQEAQDAGATTNQLGFTEGANMLTKGAELNVAALKTVLIGAFPDIDVGFSYAKKADEYAEYVQKLYRDPLGTLEGQARDALEEKLKERIKKDIQACCPNVSPDFVADTVARRLLDALPQLTATAAPTAAVPVAGKPPEKTVTVRVTGASKVSAPTTLVDAGLDLAPYVGGLISFTVTGTITATSPPNSVSTVYPDGVVCRAAGCSAPLESNRGGSSFLAQYRNSTGGTQSVTADVVAGYSPRWNAVLWFPVKPVLVTSSSTVPVPTGPFTGGPYEIPARASGLVFGAPPEFGSFDSTLSGAFVVTVTVRPK